jgi:hypothetical protein
MKTLRLALPVVLLTLCGMAFARPGATSVAPSAAQRSFDMMKNLAGIWEGPLTTNPQAAQYKGVRIRVWMRVTSRGHALVHEFQVAGTPIDPTKYDHPVTMFYLDGGRLDLVHYCDAGNRPHMAAHLSPDGKRIVFNFVRLSGGNENGHMYHVVFTFINANHHIEGWTYMMPGDKPVVAHMDLRRVSEIAHLQ